MPSKTSENLEYAPPLAAGHDFGKELVNWLFPAYVTLIVASIFLFQMRSMMAKGNAMNFDRSVLTVVNTATLTGFQQKLGPNFFKLPAQIMILLLTVVGSLFSLIVGGLAVRRILRLRFTDLQIIVAACLCEIIALLIGAAGGAGIHLSLLGGLSQGAAAFGNSGMALGRPFDISAWQTHLFVLPMIFLGGLGITVLMELYDLVIHGHPLSNHTRTVLTWGIGIYLISVLALTLIQWIAADWLLTPERLTGSWVSSSVMALNSRTAGIPYQYVSAFPRAMQWFVMALMMIGAAPGGTGGGLKITTLAVLILGMRRLLRGESPGRSLGIAMSWLGIYLSILLLGLLMLLFVEPQLAGDQVLFMAISALSNVGLSYNQLPDMPRGSFVLAALMLAGRMTPLLILWWMADSTTDAEIAVG